MKRVISIAAVIALALVVILLHSAIRDFFWTHPWWQSLFASLPAIAVPVLAIFELVHSGEANTLRFEANVLRKRVAELEVERNQHLQQIAKNTEKPVTQAERNADTLRKHLTAKVSVSEGAGNWPNAPEIVEVSDDNMVTLFTPRGFSSSSAWCAKVYCGDLEITDIPLGSCPLRLKVNKRYGPTVPLGEITSWEDRHQPTATPTFARGDTVRHATYSKPGSPETRSVHVYASGDGANSFMLVASSGQNATGDGVEVSKRFMTLQIEYQAAGFRRDQFATGVTPHSLFIS